MSVVVRPRVSGWGRHAGVRQTTTKLLLQLLLKLPLQVKR